MAIIMLGVEHSIMVPIELLFYATKGGIRHEVSSKLGSGDIVPRSKIG